MIRPFTVVCMLMAVGSGLYLYQCKHQAQVLDRKIARTIKQTDEARNRIGMLRAEWAQLNEPERIADLARAHTTLQTARPTQFIAANDLTGKLPAPVAPTRQLEPTDLPEASTAAPPLVQTEPPPPAAPRVAVSAPEAKPESKPVARAPAATEPKPVQTATEAPAAEPKPPHHPAAANPAPAAVSPQIASVHPPARPIAPPRAVTAASIPANAAATAPGTIGAAVLHAMHAREATRSTPYVQPVAAPAPAYAPPQPIAPSYTPQAYAAPVIGSMLGGARGSLPPPVPFAAR